MMICYKCDQEIDASRPYSQNATGYYHGRMLYSRTSCLNAAVRRLNTLAAEVARLRDAEETANHDAARLVYELARLGIAYEGDDPLARLVEEITALREQLDAAGEAQTTSRLSAAGKVDDGL